MPPPPCICNQLDGRLSAIEAHTKATVDLLGELRSEVRAHRLEIYGGTGHAGLRTEVDRLRESDGRRVWHVRALWGACLAGLARWASSAFGH